MTARLVFLGRLRDVAGVGEMEVPVGPLALDRLPPPLAQALVAPRIRWALNGMLIAALAGLALREGDELAFLPPVSGG